MSVTKCFGLNKLCFKHPHLLPAVMSDLRVWLWASSEAFQMFSVLFETMWAALVACENTSPSEAVCLLPSVHICPCVNTCIHKWTLWEKKMQWEWCSCMLIPCIALRESTTSGALCRIEKLFGQPSESVSIVTKFTHCTLSWMISYLLLLNEHKEIFDFGLECPWHKYSMLLLPHTPFFFTPFSFDSQKNQQCYSPCTWFLHIQGKKIYFEYVACWTRCLN